MSTLRTSIIRGPAVVTFNGATLYSKGDITLSLSVETFNVETALHGKVDERVVNRVAKIAFTPDGQWENQSVIWPYGAMALGASVFTGTDLPLVIKTQAGKTLTFSAAAITKMPTLFLSATKTMLGDIEFTCLGADGEAWTVADNLVAVGTASFSDTSFASSSILTQSYSAAWGATAPWDDIATMDGWVVEFDLSLTPVETDADGIIDMTFAGLAVRAKAKPVGITEANVIDALKLQGSGAGRGRSLNSGAANLVITGTGAIITVGGAQLMSGPLLFGSGSPRVAELTWSATRTFSSGVAASLFSIATS